MSLSFVLEILLYKIRYKTTKGEIFLDMFMDIIREDTKLV